MTSKAHGVGSGANAHPWADALGEVLDLGVGMPDSRHYTAAGRRLLVALGVVKPDPLRVAAETWLAGHRGPDTAVTRAVRAALGPPVPHLWRLDARNFRRVK